MKSKLKYLLIVAVTLLVLIVAFKLISDHQAKTYFAYDKMIGIVDKIEIVYVDTNQDNEIVLKELNLTEKDELLLGLSEIDFFRSIGDPSEPTGICIKLYYKNGTINLVSPNVTSQSITLRCPQEDFDALVSRFTE